MLTSQKHTLVPVLRLNMGKLNESETSYTQAISLRPNYAEAHHHLGKILKKLNRLDEATARYRYAIRLKPDFAEPTTTWELRFSNRVNGMKPRRVINVQLN